MNAREKAAELVIKMYQPLPASKEAEKGKEHLYYNQYRAAKQCALIAVDELISSHNKWDDYAQTNSEEYYYWQEVKQEIEKV